MRTNYSHRLQDRIQKVLENNPELTFDELCSKTSGAFPEEVYSRLTPEQKARISGLSINRPAENGANGSYPEPNPANFEWRFSNKTAESIFKLLGEEVKRVALFGTPSLYSALKERGKEVVLFDINDIFLEYFPDQSGIVITDINYFDFSGFDEFDCVILDPPWYLSYYDIWIRKGCSILKKGGIMLVTLFQPLLRPKADLEIRDIFKLANQIGAVEHFEYLIQYITPQFEKELFRHLQIPIFTNWRHADMLRIQKNQCPEASSFTIPKNSWKGVSIGNQTVFIKFDDKADEPIQVKFPYKHENSLIKTVSNRNKVKRRINLITSRNKGLIVQGQRQILNILDDLAQGKEDAKVKYSHLLSFSEHKELDKLLKIFKDERYFVEIPRYTAK